jgi:UDP:flavonoid glycosyltransferase YjiC (YdhE family)
MKCGEMQGFHLVIAVGPDIDAKVLKGDFSNVTVLNWAPQIDILKTAAVALIHGGLGTIKECIYFGVPMLIFPFARDQPLNAKRVETKGLGISCDVNTIRDAGLIENILRLDKDKSIHQNISHMQKVFRYKQDKLFGLDFIESLIVHL